MKNNITISNMSTRKIFAVHRTITTDPLITKRAEIHCTKHAGFIALNMLDSLQEAIRHIIWNKLFFMKK